MLVVPDHAAAVVLFAHGSGSSRLSPRNNYVAENLQHAGLGTLLMDLLTKQEDSIYETRFGYDQRYQSGHWFHRRSYLPFATSDGDGR